MTRDGGGHAIAKQNGTAVGNHNVIAITCVDGIVSEATRMRSLPEPLTIVS